MSSEPQDAALRWSPFVRGLILCLLQCSARTTKPVSKTRKAGSFGAAPTSTPLVISVRNSRYKAQLAHKAPRDRWSSFVSTATIALPIHLGALHLNSLGLPRTEAQGRGGEQPRS